jgi:Uma2 family endonuclease
MSPSMLHEAVKNLIGRMVEVYTLERGIEVVSGSSTTFRREDLKRGFEADECYYISHAAAVLGKDEIDLLIDPPPDLVIEVDISRSSLSKFGIYRALGVPEVWSSDGKTIKVFVLRGDEYLEVRDSAALPLLQIDVLEQFLRRRAEMGETHLIRSFRDAIRGMGSDHERHENSD